MSIFSGVIVYLMVFWTVLFTILPWGNAPDQNPEEGNATGAPANPRMKQKFIATAIVSTIIWGVIYVLIEIEIIDFYAIARMMVEEDKTL